MKIVLILLATLVTAQAAPRKIKVFVALCDNFSQGIIPVGEKIGNGDQPDSNLYWGCSDGFGSFFKRSKRWKTLKSDSSTSETILRTMTLRHTSGKAELEALAYRGSEIKQCLIDFEKTATSHQYDLVAYIGHNGLMDFKLPIEKPTTDGSTDVIVLGCLSEEYFADRLEKMGCRPVLMTRQLMYPGSFILHSAIEKWITKASLAEIRNAAGEVYAKNQKISVRAATGVFSKPKN